MPATLPLIPVPLLAPDADVTLDLQSVFTGAFDSVGYERALDYARPLNPPLPEAEAAWVGALAVDRHPD